jgi:hypothetical protein
MKSARSDFIMRRSDVDQENARYVTGTVSHRKCPLCGHREVGLVLEDGSFHPLNPGMTIAIPSPGADLFTGERPGRLVPEEEPEQIYYRLWFPEPVRGDKGLRVKYGVLVNERLFPGEMSGDLYEVSYLAKLERLVERQRDVPLPMILDRVFTSPHLASGNALQVCEAMWRELDEIRRPVRLVRAWLEKGDEESLAGMIYPRARETMGREPADDETVMKELEALSLEEFLEML